MDNKEIVKRFERHRSDRNTVEQTWDIIDRYIYPLGGGKFFQEQSQEGEMDWNRSRYIFDSTAILAHQTLAASIQSNIAPLSGRWFDLTFKHPELKVDKESVEWIEACGEEIFTTLQESNFNLEFGKSCMDISAFGNTALVEEVPNEEEWQSIDFSSIPSGKFIMTQTKKGVSVICIVVFNGSPLGSLLSSVKRIALKKFLSAMKQAILRSRKLFSAFLSENPSRRTIPANPWPRLSAHMA